ncbi:hypothetical protein [Novispirillum itersonii]|uniref:hypothetical protein n=1 Tax=Novispirillum itersonii TaxID=189 RepID=UPI00037D8E2F|nr:hypothetical protein [Novispirillum itersonii]
MQDRPQKIMSIGPGSFPGGRHSAPVLGLLALLVLSGCASHIPPGVAAIDPVTVIATDKTVIDHVTGWATGEDCSSVRAEQGGHWCVQPYENDPVTQPLYCYRTLGNVSCYAQPSNHPADKLIGVQDGGRQRTW